MLRSLRYTVAGAYAGQAVVSAACAILSWRLWRADSKNRLAATVMLTLLASPYGFTGDMAMYCAVLPLLAGRGTAWRNAALACLWVAPACVPMAVAHLGVLPTPLLLSAALALALAPAVQNTRCPAAEIPAPEPQAVTPPQWPVTAPEQA